MNKIIPAPAGWTFHAAEDWELNKGEPVHVVFPLFAFELSKERAGRFWEGAGIFFEDPSHDLGYTDEKNPYRFPIGIFGPHQGPSTEAIGEALATVKMTAANQRERGRARTSPCPGHDMCDWCELEDPCPCCGLTEEDGQMILP